MIKPAQGERGFLMIELETGASFLRMVQDGKPKDVEIRCDELEILILGKASLYEEGGECYLDVPPPEIPFPRVAADEVKAGLQRGFGVYLSEIDAEAMADKAVFMLRGWGLLPRG